MERKKESWMLEKTASGFETAWIKKMHDIRNLG